MKKIRDLLERLRLWNLRNQYEAELRYMRYWHGPLMEARAERLAKELAKLGDSRAG